MTESGLRLPRPAWVAWIAQDGDGAWWGYSVQPMRNESGWYENEVGHCIRLGAGPAGDWEHSLQAVIASDR